MHDGETRTEVSHDRLDPARERALALLLAGLRDARQHGAGNSRELRAVSEVAQDGAGGVDPAPQEPPAMSAYGHHIYFWQFRPAWELGRDGHPRTGGLIPDLGLPRRMWAGGTVEFHRALRLDEPASRHSQLVHVARKSGRSGPLGFVTLRHSYRQAGCECRSEEQHLVYRAQAGDGGAPPLPVDAPLDETRCERVHFDSTALFRYSALTQNGHRIHYDLDYCKRVEGYPGLVVHGPLLAQCLIALAEEMGGSLRSFKFRATAPLFAFETAELCARDREEGRMLWVRGPDGRQCMVAEAAYA